MIGWASMAFACGHAVWGLLSAQANRHPWFPWLLPLLYSALVWVTLRTCTALAWLVARLLPVGDPAVLLALIVVASVATLPQQRWVHLSWGCLGLLLAHLVLVLQYTSAWALDVWGHRWGLCLVSLPNLCMCGYLVGQAVVLWLLAEPGASTVPMRRLVWSAYVLTGPLLLVPQICALLSH